MNGEQLRAILWLRYRLSYNQWSRVAGSLAAIVTSLAIIGGCTSFGLGWLGGSNAGGGRAAGALVVLWVGLCVVFLFLWSIGSLVDMQRSEVIDIQRLLQFPVSLEQVFLVNYLASHVSVSFTLCVPAMLGAALGASIARGPVFLLMAPASLAVVFCTTAWSYCALGWIATWVTNPRRKRLVMLFAPLTIVACGQVPNFVHHVVGEDRVSALMAILVNGANWRAALLTTAGLTLLGAVGLARAYRDTIRHYRGGDESWRVRPAFSTGLDSGSADAGRRGGAPGSIASRHDAHPRLVERRVPGLPDEAAAVATATLRSMLRAPEVAVLVGVALVVSCLVGGIALFRFARLVSPPYRPLAGEGAMAVSVLLLFPSLCNQFGFDRDGFRTLVLSPLERRWILLGKNAAVVPFAAVACLPVPVVSLIVLHSSALTLAAAIFQLSALLIVATMAGNAISIFLPYRVSAGTLRASGAPLATTLALLGCYLASPLVFAPVFIPTLLAAATHAASPAPELVNLAASLCIAAALGGAYLASLRRLGAKLEERERAILWRVTARTE